MPGVNPGGHMCRLHTYFVSKCDYLLVSHLTNTSRISKMNASVGMSFG